ncbi:NADH-quinone oxidoreductase subunit C [Streptosporangium sp. NPDC004379]|uniref:NADH-quinone oxidoreductase subunit C n=1 Tax=Streptosporangium sp. NPDC004379 TaxID=3366189 RepID=UPI0036A8BC83
MSEPSTPEPPARPEAGAGPSTPEPPARPGPARREPGDSPDRAATPVRGDSLDRAATPVRDALLARYGERVQVSESFGETTADVPPGDWTDLLGFARTRGYVFFDWLTAVDEPPDAFSVVAHLYDPVTRAHLLPRTRVPRADPRLPSAVGVFRGADWHERETFEMFGVVFEDHPGLVPLLLPEGFEGHPLRKDFVLAARVAKAWPGAKEPGESGHGSPSRRKTLPPGVPAAGWGRDAGER